MKESISDILLFNSLPEDVIKYVLSFLNPKTAFTMKCVSNAYSLWALSCQQLEEFNSQCKAIESDTNYKPNSKLPDVLRICFLDNPSWRGHHTEDRAFILTNSSTYRNNTGKAYDILVSAHSCNHGGWKSATGVVFVQFNGSTSIYKMKDSTLHMLPTDTLNDFLGKPSFAAAAIQHSATSSCWCCN